MTLVIDYFFSTAQLEEVLDPYLADTNIGLPYWDWTKDSSVPDVFENIRSPIKAHRDKGYHWQEWKGWKRLLSVCQNPDPLSGPQSHSVRIRKKEFEDRKKDYIKKIGLRYLQHEDQFSQILHDGVKDALQKKSYEDFANGISSGHAKIHINLQCTMYYPSTTGYGLRYVMRVSQ